ncbi:MAG TPA: bifunctional DNA-formamidopyrimidine glycosylase/DNA-(apurinic or apyrimidinic site) lyase [Abditibacteriaceae bacterium]|nr:bifunctional DNA-formamidopyrimidine glycosylase/DNA-(apurinic or apyrimidinic site) lyase [Abditibacteriaceae bacterium]
MPELPEAETVRRQLEPQIVGARILQTWARLPRITQPSIAEFVATTMGQRILEARRRGKQLYFPLENGASLLVHLGMTGRLHVEATSVAETGIPALDEQHLHKHIHAVLRLDNGRQLIFTDPRTFGALGVARELAFLQKMGPEPLDEDFDERALAKKLATRSTKIKAAILDQTLVAGLGNIYADEVCFLAGVHPAQRACDVPLPKLRRLVAHMRPVLERAIAARGATLKDKGYQDTFGQYGEYYPHAYGNTGLPCANCGALIQRGVLGPGRSARSYHFCPKCQKLKTSRIASKHG